MLDLHLSGEEHEKNEINFKIEMEVIEVLVKAVEESNNNFF